MKHPNAVVGGGLPGSVAAILYLLRVFGIDLPEPPLEAGVAMGAGLSGFVLLIGRGGLRGLAVRIWRGRGES